MQQLKYDGILTIAVGGSRKELYWKNQELTWSALVKRLSQTRRTAETYQEFLSLPKSEQDEIKDVGGFVGGRLEGGRRKAGSALMRQIITLDADYPLGNLWAGVETMLGCAAVMYSTHKHCPAKPRLRLVFPLSRPVTVEEYEPVARRIAADLGIDFFDDTTYQPHRLMYWPSTAADGEFLFQVLDAPWINPNEVLARYPNWQDASFWPTSSRANSGRRKQADKQGNPQEKPGLIGAFCRTYNVISAIEQFLADVYTPTKDPGRYTYVLGSTAGGLVVYENGDFAYSHHGTDPASGKLCNAFDLVRLHKFAEVDADVKEGTPINRLPSYLAMKQLVQHDPAVKKLLATERMTAADQDFAEDKDSTAIGNWQQCLELDSKGHVKTTVTNIILIIRHDPQLASICYNEHRDCIDVRHRVDSNVTNPVPWKRLKGGWSKADDASLAYFLEKNYKIWSPTKQREGLIKAAMERSFHPVRDYLNTLPPWDGVERVDTLLVDYLGAADTDYVRAACRKTLCGAVARVLEPGVKFDSMLVLNGPQGVGKSTLFAKLAGRWFSDSLSITDMKDKTAAEKLQGCWIMEISELAGLKKAEVEVVKAFLSRQDDMYRASYGYTVESHLRQTVTVGSTNNETGFLRDITGNRRFWPVKVSGKSALKPWDITDVDQIWAEVLAKYQAGEPLYMENTLVNEAEKAQVEALESDEREGLIEEYLEKLLPENWDKLDLHTRRNFLRGDGISSSPKGTVPRQSVCVLEIWCELFGKDASTLQRRDSYAINGLMNKLADWEKYPGSIRVPIYGKQRVFLRKNREQVTTGTI